MNEPSLCREATTESLPSSLIIEFHNSKAITKAEAVLIVLKVLMNEEGFILKNNWKYKSDVRTQTLQYMHSSCPEIVCHLIISTPFPDILLVHGLFSDKLAQHKFNINAYVISNPQTQNDPLKVYRNLPSLSRKFKNHIVFPLIHFLKAKLGIENDICFVTLPREVLIHIFRKLDFYSLACVCKSSKELNEVGNDDLLWKSLFLRDHTSKIDNYRQHFNNPQYPGFWKREYARAYEFQKEQKRLRRAYISSFDQPLLWPPILPMRGGDYDRFPNINPRLDFNVGPPSFWRRNRMHW